jgi:hypothetical protein
MATRLSYERFAELTRSLRSNSPDQLNKRVKPRVGLRAQVEIILPSHREPILVWVRDVSEGGIGLLVGMEVHEGLEFLISLVDRDKIPHLIRGVVAYSRKVATHLYAVGARLEPSSEKAVPHAKASPSAAHPR